MRRATKGGFYGELCPHSSLGGCTPGDVYRGTLGEAGVRQPENMRAGNATATMCAGTTRDIDTVASGGTKIQDNA